MPPGVIMAQMVRAVLLARATAASLRGLRSSNCRGHIEADLLPGLAKRMTDMAPTNSNCHNLSLPALLILPMRYGARHLAKPHPLAMAEFTTLKMRVLKIAGRITEITSRVRVAFAAACPDAVLFRQHRHQPPARRIVTRRVLRPRNTRSRQYPKPSRT